MHFTVTSITSIALCVALVGTVAAEQSAGMFRQGLEFRVGGKPAKAVEAFTAVLEKDPWNSEALVQMGASLEDLKKWNQAAEAYKKALVIDPANWVARRNQQQLMASRDMHKPLHAGNAAKERLMASGVEAVERGDYARAGEIFRLCRGLSRNDPKPLFYEGFCHERAGRIKEAAALYEQVVASHPGYAPGWVNLIIALLSTGDRDGAAGRLRTALRILPKDRRIRSLERLTVPERKTVLSSRMGSGP